jgi:hypothetical protein
MNTGTNLSTSTAATTGNGAWIFYPRVSVGPCFFYLPGSELTVLNPLITKIPL